jgi:large subunit ribosomal protein L10
MSSNLEQKKKKSAELAKDLSSASGFFFAFYQGLKFTEISALREKLAPAKCRFRVIRNSILGHALKEAGIEHKEDIKGPGAVAIQSDGDVTEVAKVLRDFQREFPALKVKSGYSSNAWYNAEDCKKLASLGTRAEVMSQLAGNLYSCISQIASVLQAPIRDLAFVLKAVEDKKSSQAA